MIVESRVAVDEIAKYLAEKYGVEFHWNTAISCIDYQKVISENESGKLMQSWHGIYPKMMNGQTELIVETEPGVTVINGLGGNGMTLSFGLCEEFIAKR